MIGRRGFIAGLVSLVAAPAIVRVGSLMPVKVMIEPAGMIPTVWFRGFNAPTLAEWAQSIAAEDWRIATLGMMFASNALLDEMPMGPPTETRR